MRHFRNERPHIRMHTLLDISIVVFSFISAYFIKKDLLPGALKGLSISPNYYIVLLLIIIIWYLVFKLFNLYTPFFHLKIISSLYNTYKANVFAMIILITILYLLKIKNISRFLLGFFFIQNILILSISKLLLYKYKFFYKDKKNIHKTYNILIIGSKQRAKDIINLIYSSNIQCQIIGCLDTRQNYVGKFINKNIKVIGTIDNLKDIITSKVVDEVLFAMPLKEIVSVDVYMLLIEMVGVKIRIFPEWHIHALEYKPGIASINYENFSGQPSLVLSTTRIEEYDLALKITIDYIFSVIIFLFSLPFFIIIPIMIKLFSRGPVLFKQIRVGLYGRKFYLYKFRTMINDAENKVSELNKFNEADGPVFKIKKDPRIIPIIGTFLRKTSLDELPQLINVLRGEMSLVGPRPPLPDEVKHYEVWQRRRMSMKPGLTCLWQITSNRNDLTFHQWVELDLKYIDKWSLKLDIKIILKTIVSVFCGQGR